MHFYDSLLLHMYKSFKVGWEHQRRKIFRKIDSERIYVDGVSQRRVNDIYMEKIRQYIIGRCAFNKYIDSQASA